MGFKAGEYIAKLHPKGSAEGALASFPGPPGAGWVEAGNKGFNHAIKRAQERCDKIRRHREGSAAKTGRGRAPGQPEYQIYCRHFSEPAVQLLRERNLSDKIKVIAYYFTPGVYENIKAGRVMAAPTDSAVVQGRVSIDQAVRILEGKPYLKHVGPKIYVIDKANINSFDYASSLAPADWKPIFTVN